MHKQAEVGGDVLNDGELSKPSYATYVKDRPTGLGADLTDANLYRAICAAPTSAK
jgi:hypothetical protein